MQLPHSASSTTNTTSTTREAIAPFTATPAAPDTTLNFPLTPLISQDGTHAITGTDAGKGEATNIGTHNVHDTGPLITFKSTKDKLYLTSKWLAGWRK